ncbi:MAG: dephospho-CoA kinase [Tissierellia bacterium]|nr:dephospho-CoA kinase [Tissierellia bacterium]
MNPNRARRILITGSIATGKSKVSSYLKDRGMTLVDADEIARDLSKDPAVLSEVAQTFGPEYVVEGGFNREALAQLVFADPERRRELNAILHPRIYDEIRRPREGTVVFYDIPLYFEVEEELNFPMDDIWVVATSPEVQLQRLMARDGIDEDFARAKIEGQMSQEEKVARAHVVLNNDGTEEELFEQVDRALEKISK